MNSLDSTLSFASLEGGAGVNVKPFISKFTVSSLNSYDVRSKTCRCICFAQSFSVLFSLLLFKRIVSV